MKILLFQYLQVELELKELTIAQSPTLLFLQEIQLEPHRSLQQMTVFMKEMRQVLLQLIVSQVQMLQKAEINQSL